jgi:hypothetical protein
MRRLSTDQTRHSHAREVELIPDLDQLAEQEA